MNFPNFTRTVVMVVVSVFALIWAWIQPATNDNFFAGTGIMCVVVLIFAILWDLHDMAGGRDAITDGAPVGRSTSPSKKNVAEDTGAYSQTATSLQIEMTNTELPPDLNRNRNANKGKDYNPFGKLTVPGEKQV